MKMLIAALSAFVMTACATASDGSSDFSSMVFLWVAGVAGFVIVVVWSVLWFMVPFYIRDIKRAVEKMANK